MIDPLEVRVWFFLRSLGSSNEGFVSCDFEEELKEKPLIVRGKIVYSFQPSDPFPFFPVWFEENYIVYTDQIIENGEEIFINPKLETSTFVWPFLKKEYERIKKNANVPFPLYTAILATTNSLNSKYNAYVNGLNDSFSNEVTVGCLKGVFSNEYYHLYSLIANANRLYSFLQKIKK